MATWLVIPIELPASLSPFIFEFISSPPIAIPPIHCNLNVTATYTLTEDNALKLEFKATTDKPTIVNLTQHSYFNLAGQGNGDILGHLVYINSTRPRRWTAD